MMSDQALNRTARSPLFEYIRFSEFKRLLGQLSSTLDRDGRKTVAILSEFPGEGKTFLVSALALGYSSLLNRRVLVVNTIRQTKNRSLFYKTVFQDEALTLASPGQLVPVSRTIDLISPFQEDPLQSDESSDFQLGVYIDSVKANYDVVLFDTVSLNTNNKQNMDPVIVARQVDASILLTTAQSGSREVVTRVKRRLQQCDIRLSGIVFNSGPRQLQGVLP